MAGVLDRVPFLAGYQQQGVMDQQRALGEGQQVTQAMGILGALQQQAARQQAAQREQAMRGVLGQLGPDATPEQVIGAVRQFASPDDILRITQSAADRKAALEAARLKQKPELVTVAGPDGKPMQKWVLPGQSTGVDVGAPYKAPPAFTPKTRTVVQGAEQVQQELQPDNTWLEVGRGPRFQAQVVPHVNVAAPVTPVTIQDPNDPNKTIIIDGRTRQVLGAGPKLTEGGKLENKRAFAMSGLGETISQAEDLLTGVKRLPDGTPVNTTKPTGSGLGTAVDFAGSLVGISPKGADEAQALQAISGALVSKMPRMEGPQSDKDVMLYKQMAGEVGNSMLPISRRVAALQKVKELWGKYEQGGSQGQGATAGWDGQERRTAPAGKTVKFGDLR